MKYPLVFIPGMMCDSRLFQPQISEFSKQYLVCIAPLSYSDSIEKISFEILRQLPPKFTLIGLSMGGILAMEIIKKGNLLTNKFSLDIKLSISSLK